MTSGSGINRHPLLGEETQMSQVIQRKRLPPRLQPILLNPSAKKRLHSKNIRYERERHYANNSRRESNYDRQQRRAEPLCEIPKGASYAEESLEETESRYPGPYDARTESIASTWNSVSTYESSTGPPPSARFSVLDERETRAWKELARGSGNQAGSASALGRKRSSAFGHRESFVFDSASKLRTTDEVSRASESSRRPNLRCKLSMDSSRRGLGCPLPETLLTSTGPPQPLLAAILRNEGDSTTPQTTLKSSNDPKHANMLYPSQNGRPPNPSMLNITSTPLGKDIGWGMMAKTSPQRKSSVFPDGQGVLVGGGAKRKKSHPISMGARCCSVYGTIAENVRNKWILLLLAHCSLFVALVLYILLGAAMLMKIDGGRRYAVRGKGEEDRVGLVRGFAADRLLNISLKAVLEKSRDAVLDTIFMSDELQAALTTFKASRMNILPGDRELELLSQVVLRNWHQSIEELLVKYHFITIMEAQGYRVSADELPLIWDKRVDVIKSNEIYGKAGIGTLPWDFWSASIHIFGLMTTMGIRTLSPSNGGRAFNVIYTLLGVPLYFFIVLVWSRRLLEGLMSVSKSRLSPTNRKISHSDNLHGPTGGWHAPSSVGESPPSPSEPMVLTLFICFTLTVAYIIGLGPLVCGSLNNSFGERLEATFLCLLLVSPPSPLPQDSRSCSSFIVFVLVGHLSLAASILSLKRLYSSSDSYLSTR